MKAGGIGSVRLPINWATRAADGKRAAMTGAASTPRSRSPRAAGLNGPALPLRHAALDGRPSRRRCRSTAAGRGKAWVAFVKAAVERYGPGGDVLGRARARRRRDQLRAGDSPAGADPHLAGLERGQLLLLRLPGLAEPLRAPAEADPAGAIKAADPSAKIILSGLFGDPDEGGKRGMDAADFLAALYRAPGIKRYFDASRCTPMPSTSTTWKN